MNKEGNVGTKLVMSYNQRQRFLKTSGLAKLFGVDHLLPEVKENIECQVSLPLKSTRAITNLNHTI